MARAKKSQSMSRSVSYPAKMLLFWGRYPFPRCLRLLRIPSTGLVTPSIPIAMDCPRKKGKARWGSRITNKSCISGCVMWVGIPHLFLLIKDLSDRAVSFRQSRTTNGGTALANWIAWRTIILGNRHLRALITTRTSYKRVSDSWKMPGSIATWGECCFWFVPLWAVI